MSIHLPPRVCRDLSQALEREWLVTNGLGGYAAGTIAGALTRRYHGLLIAALSPPVDRRLLVAKLDCTAELNGQKHLLYTNIWRDGVEQPNACRVLWRFDLVDGVPAWTFRLGQIDLVQRIWMEHGRNVTYVRYETAAGAAAPVTLSARLLVGDRDHHFLGSDANRGFQVEGEGPMLEIRPPQAPVVLQVRCAAARGSRVRWRIGHTWCRGFALPVEQARGFDYRDDYLAAGLCTLRLEPGRPATFVLAAGDASDLDVDGAWERCTARARELIERWTRHCGMKVGPAPHRRGAARARVAARSARTPQRGAPEGVATPTYEPSVALRQLVLAADQFMVQRAAPGRGVGQSVIAGYPWFTDWGRDTMIALPGLTMITGRTEIAREILRTWAAYVDQGLIPNRFPDAGGAPEYLTADAALWYLWAIDQYVRATADVETLAELFPVMQSIVDSYLRGTRHEIRVWDDGLVAAGHAGLNLTWMDARIGERVVTPRAGKPIELSALWYDGLCNLARLADLLDESGDRFARLAAGTRRSFQRFWNGRARCCFDVIDGPDGCDARVRPNQLLAVSLTHSPLEVEQQEAVLRKCEHELLTWFGLRTLARGESGYRGRYAGGPAERDEAYHQGAAWGWLLGPLVLAHWRLHHDRVAARRLLEPLLGQLWSSGIGTLSEIFEGDEPHRADGCFAQAWSVAETLRAWWMTQH